MDFGSSSEAKMTGQTHNTSTNKLGDCAKIDKMSSFKVLNDPSVDDPFQPDPTPYYKRVKTQSQIANEGFPKFSELPAELRSKVWGYAMPPYGVFTVLMLGREEPRPQQPPAPAPLAFRAVYRLEPVPHDQQDDGLRVRLEAMRAIQHTNSEAASEVQRAFPTTISCTSGKLRFNAEHDTLSLSDLQCPLARGLAKRFERYNQGAIVFTGDWHKIPRKMVFNNEGLWVAFDHRGFISMPQWWIPTFGVQSRVVEGFAKFLAECTRLGTFGFMCHRPCRSTVPDLGTPDMHEFQVWWQQFLKDKVLPFCCPGPIMQDSFYNNEEAMLGSALEGFVRSLESLEILVHGPLPGQDLPVSLQGLRLGLPELQHLHLQAMLPISPELHDGMKRAGE